MACLDLVLRKLTRGINDDVLPENDAELISVDDDDEEEEEAVVVEVVEMASDCADVDACELDPTLLLALRTRFPFVISIGKEEEEEEGGSVESAVFGSKVTVEAMTTRLLMESSSSLD